MPPQPRSGMKPDPTMLLCYVPDLVFTINRDAPFIYRGAICGMRNVRDILTFFFSESIYPAMRGAPTAGSSFYYDPVYDGISASLQHADLHGLSGCFF